MSRAAPALTCALLALGLPSAAQDAVVPPPPPASSGGLPMPVLIMAAVGAVVVAAALAYMLVRRNRNRKLRKIKAREMAQYQQAVELERAARALQRAREVLAERTGNAEWNPKLEQNVQKMQLDDMPSEDDDDPFDTDGPFQAGEWGDPAGAQHGVAVCTQAMQLVEEYGAQGAMVQVMHAAKKVLEQELRDLERSEGAVNIDGTIEEEVEDVGWRERVADQMQMKELERQLAAVDEETEDMLSEEERQRRKELEALKMEGTVELETFPTVGHKILVRCAPPALRLAPATRNALPGVARGGMHEWLSERLRCGTGSTRRRRLAPSPGPRCRRPSTVQRRRRSWYSAPARSPRRCGSIRALSGRCRKRSSGTTAGGRCIPALSRSAQRHSFFSQTPYEIFNGCWLETQEVEAANAAGRPVIDAPDEEGAGPPLEIDMIPPKPQLKIQSGKSRLTDDGVVVGGTEQVASA